MRLSLGRTLDLRQKLYQRSIWPSVSKVVSGQSLKAPFLVEIDPTSYCDLSCPECVSRDLLNSSKFSRQRLIDLSNEIVAAGVQAVIFVGGGEPLVHPAMPEVIEIFGRAGVRIGVITNGTQLHRYTALLARYADWVRVSVDAASSDTFSSFRPHRSGRSVFPEVIENMRALKGAGVRSLGFSFLLISRQENGHVIQSNYSELYAAGCLAKGIGCDYFEVKPVFDAVTHVVDSQPREMIEQLKHQLVQLEALEDGSFKIVVAQALIELIQGEFLAKLYDYGKCHIAELRTLISPTGVYICPLYRGNVAFSFGDPTRETFDQIWNGPVRDHIMKTLRPCTDCLPKCSRHLSNIAIDKISKLGAPQIIDDYDFFI